MSRLITYSQALAILEDCDEKGVPRPFSITFCTADRTRGTGGETIHYEKAVWHIKNGRRPDPEASAASEKSSRTKPRSGWTRNIRGFDTDQIRKVHVHLILTINGLDVR